ncbi:MAG TPA: arylamine N-acetyltransferase, partial [Anaerolineales bacterium]|nr:arylamine N-acetyltransferase [Anaerolineales bacterium]
MDIRTYLARIKYSLPVRVDLESLRGLQLAHMLSVPFENLDIVPLRKPIHLDEESLWDKIVERRRGGFCYELNGLFAWLLKQIGF